MAHTEPNNKRYQRGYRSGHWRHYGDLYCCGRWWNHHSEAKSCVGIWYACKWIDDMGLHYWHFSRKIPSNLLSSITCAAHETNENSNLGAPRGARAGGGGRGGGEGRGGRERRAAGPAI